MKHARWLFMPLGLLALVAAGVHAAADVVDDHLLGMVEAIDLWFDNLFVQSEHFAAWAAWVDVRERTVIARALAVTWELLADFFIALPALGYDEDGGARASFKTVLKRLNQMPVPMKVLRPFITGVFAVGGAYAVSKLVESTLFAGMVGDVAPPDVAALLARAFGALAIIIVLASHGWRAVIRALQHADDACEARRKRKWLTGTTGTLVSLPLAIALLLQARALVSLVL